MGIYHLLRKMTEEKPTCKKCGREMEYSALLDCMCCPVCTRDKVVREFFIPKLLKEYDNK